MSGFNVGTYSKEKFFAMQRQPKPNEQQQKAQEQQQKQQQKEMNQQQSMTTGLQWNVQNTQQTATSQAVQGTQNNQNIQQTNNQKGDSARIVLKDDGDTATLSTTVLASSVTGADEARRKKVTNPLKAFRNSAQQKFTEMFSDSFAGSFSHNRLLGKMSELKAGVAMKMMSMLGVPPATIEGIRSRVRHELIGQNKTNMEQVVYDKTLLEIVS